MLEKLTNATGDILENIELIENLESTKKISIDVAEKVAIAKETELRINETSENYRPVANRGALLFFLLCDLVKMHTFYMYSLESFTVVVNRGIDSLSNKRPLSRGGNSGSNGGVVATAEAAKKEEDEKPAEGGAEGEAAAAPAVVVEEEEKVVELSPKELAQRVELLVETITKFVFSYVRRGVFERHKLIFATMLCFKVLVSFFVFVGCMYGNIVQNVCFALRSANRSWTKARWRY